MLISAVREVPNDTAVYLRGRIEASSAQPAQYSRIIEWASMISASRAGILFAGVSYSDGLLVRLPAARIDAGSEFAKTAGYDGSSSDRALDPAAGML